MALVIQPVAAVHGVLDGGGDHRLRRAGAPGARAGIVTLRGALGAIAADGPEAAVGIRGPDDDSLRT